MKGRVGGGDSLPSNNVQTFREDLMMSKAELARKAGLSTLTIDRVEAGRPCRLDTKRKILLALGLRVSDKDRIFSLDGELDMGASMNSASQGSRSTERETAGPSDSVRDGLSAEAGSPEPRGPWRGDR
jgi:DNA-binding XRE family transcriptional regulator